MCCRASAVLLLFEMVRIETSDNYFPKRETSEVFGKHSSHLQVGGTYLKSPETECTESVFFLKIRTNDIVDIEVIPLPLLSLAVDITIEA